MSSRRGLLKAGTVGAVGAVAGAVLAKPAIAQANPDIRWRMPSSFPRSLDTIYGGGATVSRRVAQLTDGKFKIDLFPPPEIVPAFGTFDAVQNGTVEIAHSASFYYTGKDPTLAFDSQVPFGFNFRMINAWHQAGGAREVMRELFESYNMVSIPCGNTCTQMGGWFRKEIKTMDDMKGLKIRIPGLGGAIMQRLGAVPQQIAGGDIYPALERGAIDAAEWVGPYDDEKLGFNKVAPFYYYPGWWEGGASLNLHINKAKWDSLPKHYQEAIEVAAKEATMDMVAKYDVVNPDALRRLVASGTQLRPWPREIMLAAYTEANKYYEELATTNPRWKKVWDHFKAFRDSQYQWARIAEFSYMQIALAAHAQAGRPG